MPASSLWKEGLANAANMLASPVGKTGWGAGVVVVESVEQRRMAVGRLPWLAERAGGERWW